ncbi:ATP-binding protein [Actinomadura sp. NPDC047616]|uniref:ATP-binding protein n=1 Tax=Actinomadura sp. NPDC047616 TaxID=3155914 RepID=UPI003410A723
MTDFLDGVIEAPDKCPTCGEVAPTYCQCETPPPPDEPPPEASGGKGKGPSQAAVLVKIARDRFDLFMSDDGRPYAVAKDGPNIARPLRGKAGLRALLAKIYADEQGGAVPAQSALTDAMTVLEGVAQTAEPRTPHLRVARDGERVVVDLGTTDGRCVVVGPDGWERCPRSPVLFRRSGAMKSLPDPVRDGDGLARLSELLNVDTDSFRLLVAWLAAAFIPDLPHPILAFRGEQGTGKSKSAQMVIGIIDPSGAPKRTAPRDVKSWATQAFNSWGLCLDNVSYIPDWLSDALCRAVTGDGIVDRALYTDDDVVVLEFRRVLALTTIDAGALAGDLAERLLTIELSLIKDTERREEAELDRAFADAHAAILASLFDLLAQVLKALPDVTLTERPRMADFARVLAAVDHITGWETLKHYKDGARNAVADVLEGEPFAQAVVKLVDQAGEDGVTATAQQILELVDTPDRLPKKWPKDATRAGGQLKRLAPALRTIGVEVTESRNKHGRFWTLTATDERRKRQREGHEIEGANDRHQRHPEGSTAGMTSENRGDASSVTAASPLPGLGGPGDAGDATGDAETSVASPDRTPSDQAQQVPGDAGDGGDAKTRPLSQDATPALGAIGECAGCGGPMRIITPGQTCHPNDNCERQARDRGAA